MENFNKEDPQTSFGAFKPVGNVVAVFHQGELAVRAQRELVSGGHEPQEVVLLNGAEMVAMLDDLRDDQSDFALLGSELRKSDEFRKHAEKPDASFLVVQASDEEATQKVIEVVKSHNFIYALKYGNFLIERFDSESLSN